MLAKFPGQFDKNFFSRHKTILVSLSLLLVGCSNITIKPKDPELIALENFARKVTTELFELNPSTYSEFQKSLEKDIAPDVLSQLNKKGLYANSKTQIQKNIQLMDVSHKRCLIRIDSTFFPSKATAQGLIPIEVQGSAVKTLNDMSKASKFDVLYLVGTRTGTKEPIIASIEIKKFD
jgi:hypothetical protein